MRSFISFLQHRANDVAALLMAALFATFIVAIVSRYVFNAPLGWTLELSLTFWLWLVFWSSAFVLGRQDHVTFDLFYLAAGRSWRRAFALVSALAILVGFAASLPATIDYVTFYKIKESATLNLRLDYVFSVYLLFAVAVLVHYAIAAVQALMGVDADSPRPGASAPPPPAADGAGRHEL